MKSMALFRLRGWFVALRAFALLGCGPVAAAQA
jgi:hypothetical protein